ncbi:MAG: hydroxymethylbilane synthase [Opitutales bacterium]|nr:hydroxymethylbilane synthase [Opitutales bacterium]
MKTREIVIGSRRSPLAMAQARLVQKRLESVYPGCRVNIREFVTQGDKKLSWSLEKTGGKGLFTSELEAALLDGAIDVAVHSGKDLPTEIRAGTLVAGCLARACARDVLVVRTGTEKIRTVATGSPRRRGQLKKLFPQADFQELRGNVESRLRKIAQEHAADATVLAAAGLERLGIKTFPGLEFKVLPAEICVPAAGQALIAMQCRERDRDFFAKAAAVAGTRAFEIERAFLSALGEGCHTAFAAHYSRGVLRLFREDFGLRRLKVSFPQNPLKLKEKVKKILEGIL